MNTNQTPKGLEQDFSSLEYVTGTTQKTDHCADMISLHFISELNKVLEAKGTTLTEFADSLSVSKSYVSQLFSGSKRVNCRFLAQAQEELDIKFEIKAVGCEMAFIDKDTLHWNNEQVNHFLEKYRPQGGSWFYVKDRVVQRSTSPNSTTELSKSEKVKVA